jgi:hypothetical protein
MSCNENGRVCTSFHFHVSISTRIPDQIMQVLGKRTSEAWLTGPTAGMDKSSQMNTAFRNNNCTL